MSPLYAMFRLLIVKNKNTVFYLIFNRFIIFNEFSKLTNYNLLGWLSRRPKIFGSFL